MVYIRYLNSFDLEAGLEAGLEERMSGLKNLDLNLLIVFEAVYSSGNISQAAKRLGMSQPTISNALGRLRDRLDDPLFVRAGRGVEPTPKAVQMIGPIREALQMIEGGVAPGDHFDPTTSTRHFRIVVMDGVEPIVMPHLIRQVQAHKSVTFENLAISNTPMSDGLNDGSLDLVIASFLADSHDTHCEPLGTPHLSVVARKDHPAIDGKFTLAHFQSLGHVALTPKLRALSRMEEGLRTLNIDRHVVYSVNKFWSFPHVLTTTDLIAILPTAFARIVSRNYPLALHELPFTYPEELVYMTWKTSRTNDPGHRWLRGEIVKALKQAADAAQPMRRQPAQ